MGLQRIFATLYAKMWRIKKLFAGAARMQRTAVTVGKAMAKIGVILAIDVIILAVWTAVDPLEWNREVILTDKYGDALSSQGYCVSEHYLVFLSLLAVLHFGVLAAGSYYCYQSWAIPTQFSEGKFVGIAILANLQVFLVGVPILLIVGADPDSSFFVRTAIMFLNNITVLGFVFSNLIFAVHNDKVVLSTRTAIKSFVDRQSMQSSVGRNNGSQYDGEDDEKYHTDDWTNDLIMAAARGDMEKLKALLDDTIVNLETDRVDVHSRANIDAGDYDGRRALHLAAGEGQAEIVEELCIRGANVNVEDRWGGRPIDDAIRCKHLKCAEILATYGARAGRRHDMTSRSISSTGVMKCARQRTNDSLEANIDVDGSSDSEASSSSSSPVSKMPSRDTDGCSKSTSADTAGVSKASVSFSKSAKNVVSGQGAGF